MKHRAHTYPLRDSPRAALVVLDTPVAATCCDGRMTLMVVNRDGKTRCTLCDFALRDANPPPPKEHA